jgi:DNA-binding HxlR family transcriptional regulator
LEIFDDAQATYEPSTETLEQCIDIFSTFANLDTIRIFLLAKRGISNSNKAIKELDLTPKRYYSRLKALVDSGVLEKVNGVYVYTPVGEMLHSLGLSLINLVDNKQKIGLLLNLSKSEALSDEERQKINSVIIGKNDIGVVLGSMIQRIPQEKVEKISGYKELVEALAHAIASSKKSILLASRYFDVWVVDECLKAQERGNELRVLISKETMSKKMNKLRMMLSPKIIMKVLEMSNEKKIEDILREIELSFSFCIIDGSECFFEFPSVGGEFSIAFKFKDNETSKKFTQLFNSIWESRNVNKTLTLKEISE